MRLVILTFAMFREKQVGKIFDVLPESFIKNSIGSSLEMRSRSTKLLTEFIISERFTQNRLISRETTEQSS